MTRGSDVDERFVPDCWTADSVRANGLDVASYRVGDRDASTVVVAHGFYEDARCQRPLVDVLADEYDVVAYDARGHGHTDAPESGYALDDRIADLLGVLDALDLENPVLYGHSMGGGTVGATAARHGDRIRGVVMADPSSLRGAPEQDPDELAAFVEQQVADANAKSLEELAAEFAEEHPDIVAAHPGMAETFARADHCLSPNLAAQGREPPALLDEHFSDIDVPALVLRRDVDVDERVRDHDIADTLPDGRLVHVPDAGHHVVLTEPDAALAEIRTFLRRLESDDA